jgi:hypothetical protein
VAAKATTSSRAFPLSNQQRLEHEGKKIATWTLLTLLLQTLALPLNNQQGLKP